MQSHEGSQKPNFIFSVHLLGERTRAAAKLAVPALIRERSIALFVVAMKNLGRTPAEVRKNVDGLLRP